MWVSLLAVVRLILLFSEIILVSQRTEQLRNELRYSNIIKNDIQTNMGQLFFHAC